MNKILVTRQIPEKFKARLEQYAEVEMWDHHLTPMPRTQFLEAAKDKTALLVTLSEQIDETLFQAAPHLKIVANMAVGYDNIDLAATERHEVVVTNTPHVLTETTAELGFALMLATSRRIVEAEKYVQDGKWESWGPYLLAGKDIYRSKVGIYGMGEIGRAFARRLKGFNADILYHNRSRNAKAEHELGAFYTSFETLVKESDFIISTAPSTPETQNKFNYDVFKMMRNDAIFINIGRGDLVVEEDLIRALEEQEIAGAGLDVVRNEPIQMDHPLLKFPNVIITPHIGSASILTRDQMIQACILNIEDVFNGCEARNKISVK
ncbi:MULTISPECIES: 2-hydroxyacid dehydrogenase [Staphylococcus]|uniref:D-glycerate dehydrogenase n=1 Tax=Staphylococcus agnetis TaxID=985762 RepID=A0A2T4ML99_9STAP|nr:MULTISPECIES: D-glycerate dehydrogenase [Staphylococcus]ALN75916.1 D-glycerate dehydrogenase [Staphylococcus agnetis]MDG4943121.1 D-glycerate dehydrogenase [Staphylococcus agnetis]NHM92051.1 D-glycerate dehydrogenase [Staphylococcus sp. 10602379]NJI02862.1 D-glycerate dehydrogenase [Staphylococcus agnetis]NJI13483.1 D-glycerate dehydrogenase [Staphylococcus agnetis]